jgi:hypothetical protein
MEERSKWDQQQSVIVFFIKTHRTKPLLKSEERGGAL